jgi:hypothetical protein
VQSPNKNMKKNDGKSETESESDSDSDDDDDCCVKKGKKCLKYFPFRYFCVTFWFFIIGVTIGAAILQNIPTQYSS